MTHTSSIQILLQETCNLLEGGWDFKNQILDRIRSFPKIILRGAGSRGHDVYRLLWGSAGVEKENMAYWDIQVKSPAQCNKLLVFPLFEGGFNPEKTLVIHCVGDALPYDAEAYSSQGYMNSVDGNLILTLYDKFYCPYYKGLGRDMRLCQPNARCSFFACEKSCNTWARNTDICLLDGMDQTALIFNSLCMDVNTICTLKCKYCCQYMNHYPAEEKINFSFERIKRDIDLICEVSDFIRELHFQGGEFFLHPNSAEIIDYALEKTKIGIVSVISNCVCKLDESDLDAMNHERFVLRVSDYADQLSMKQKRLFNTNIAKLEAYGISYLINNFEWIMPPDMRDLKHCEDRKIKNHSTCFHKESKRGRLIHNGIYYPCQRAKELAVHHVVDYPDNYLVIDTASSPEERKKIIIGLNERKFYPSCSHCDYTLPIVLPGEQGVEPAYQHLGYPVRQD